MRFVGRFFSRLGYLLKHAGQVVIGREMPGLAWYRAWHNDASPPTPEADHHDAQQQVRAGRRAYDFGEYEKAEAHFRKAIALDHQYVRAYSDLGQALYKQGRTNEAVTMWRHIADTHPDSEYAAKAKHRIHKVDKEKNKLGKWIEQQGRGE
jgi:tetratricopeptide (TPR) repeat protein